MLHPVFVGFFDRDGLKRNEIIVLEKIDIAFVRRRLMEAGQLSSDGKIGKIRNDVFVLEDGYFECRDVIRSQEAAEFVAYVAREAGCQVAYFNVDEPQTPEQFLQGFHELQKMRQKLIASQKAAAKSNQ